MSLQEQLARVAESAPVAAVAPDTWDRAQRARRRDRATLVAATAAVVAVVAGLVTVVTTAPAPDPPVAGSASAGVPDHLHGVPERLTGQDGGGGWTHDRVSSDLAVGRAAAAYVLDGGLPVVVDATDGAYHLLDLPDFTGNQTVMARGLAPPALALSPDGGRLAWSYGVIGPDAATAPIPSGVRVLDLGTGEVRETPLTDGEGTAVTRLAWSPDGRWLGWAGQVARSWTAGSYGSEGAVVGRLRPGGAPTGAVAVGNDDLALAVDDRGLVSWVLDGRLHRWADVGPPASTRLPLPGFPGRASALPGGALAVGTDELAAVLVEEGAATTLEVSGGLPPVGGGSADVLGEVGGRLLVRTRALDATDGELLLVGHDGRARTVGVVEPDVPRTLTVAVDLMTADRPTVARPAPEWPWSSERWAAAALGGAVVVTAALLLLTRRRRGARGQPRAAR